MATTPSIRPHRSTPAPMILSPPSRVVTLSPTATASPPAASISATSASATSLFGSSPARPDADVGHHHPGPLRRGGQGHRPSDAATGSRDGHHLALQELAHCPLPLWLYRARDVPAGQPVGG